MSIGISYYAQQYALSREERTKWESEGLIGVREDAFEVTKGRPIKNEGPSNYGRTRMVANRIIDGGHYPEGMDPNEIAKQEGLEAKALRAAIAKLRRYAAQGIVIKRRGPQ